MIVLALMLLAWGVALLALARPLHTNWRQMLMRLQGAGIRHPPFGTRFVASPRGLLAVRVVGACGVLAAAILLVLTLVKG